MYSLYNYGLLRTFPVLPNKTAVHNIFFPFLVMESEHDSSYDGNSSESDRDDMPQSTGQVDLPTIRGAHNITGEEYRQISTNGADYKELCQQRRCRHATTTLPKYAPNSLRCYVVQCDIGQNTELTSELFYDILCIWNSKKRDKMVNWMVCECVHEGPELCMPGRHLHFIYENFATKRGEHMEKFWNILRQRLTDKTDSFNVKKRKIKSQGNFVETSCYYGILAYITAGLYLLYPCKTNLYGQGDIYEQCCLENESDLTDKDHEQYHACHPDHGICYEDKEETNETNTAYTTLSAFWDKYGPMKVKEIFSNPNIPVQERIRLSEMKFGDSQVWDNLLSVWLESVFSKLPYVTVFERYGKKQTDPLFIAMHYSLLQDFMNFHFPNTTVQEDVKMSIKNWLSLTTKKNTLWISGVPNAGKSFLAKMICNLVVFYKKNAASKNFPLDGLSNSKMIWLEEFTSSLITKSNASFYKQIFGGECIRGDNKFSGIETIWGTPILVTTNEEFDIFQKNVEHSTKNDKQAWDARVKAINLARVQYIIQGKLLRLSSRSLWRSTHVMA